MSFGLFAVLQFRFDCILANTEEFATSSDEGPKTFWFQFENRSFFFTPRETCYKIKALNIFRVVQFREFACRPKGKYIHEMQTEEEQEGEEEERKKKKERVESVGPVGRTTESLFFTSVGRMRGLCRKFRATNIFFFKIVYLATRSNDQSVWI